MREVQRMTISNLVLEHPNIHMDFASLWSCFNDDQYSLHYGVDFIIKYYILMYSIGVAHDLCS